MKKSSHTSHHTVQFHETDMAGFVHFPNIFHWAEQAEFEFMNAIGVSLIETGTKSMKAWPRVHVEAEYINPLLFKDSIAICISIKAIGKHSITYSIDLFKREDNQWAPASRVKMKTVYATGEGPGLPMQKKPIPEFILDKIEVASSNPTPQAPSK